MSLFLAFHIKLLWENPNIQAIHMNLLQLCVYNTLNRGHVIKFYYSKNKNILSLVLHITRGLEWVRNSEIERIT